MISGLVDFHCHLDLYPEHATAFAEREREGVYTLAVTTTPKAWPRNRDLAAGTRYVRAALGLHPQLVSNHSNEFPIWMKYLPEARFIGEVGLDAGPHYYKSLNPQKELFEQILKACAEQGNKILSVHSVRAVDAVLDLVESNFPPGRGSVVLHWFTGTLSQAKRAVELGCYFSINGEMLKKEYHRKLVATLPSERILTESDGPFTRLYYKSSHTGGLAEAVETLARIRNMDSLELSKVIISNLRCLVGEELVPQQNRSIY